MPDPSQSPTPASVLAGTSAQSPPAPPLADAPLNTRPGTPPSLPPQPPPPPPVTPQIARHAAIGQAATALFGQERDANGQPVQPRPGDTFRKLLAGFLLGSALGSEGPAKGGSVGSFLGGLGRGASGVEQQNYARQQAAQQTAFDQQQRRQQMSIEQQRADDEMKMHAAQMEQWNLESLARAREADYRDRDQLEKEQSQDDNLQKWAVESNAQLAPIPGNATPGNGPKMMRDMTNNPASFQAPQGYGRLLTKHLSFDGLDYDSKTGWTEGGKPVDWSKHMQWDVYYVPLDPQSQKKIVMSGANWEKYYGVKGLDPTQDYSVNSVSSLVAAATTQRKNDRESSNQDFKEKHDALMATVSSAKTNIAQYESEKRELLRDNSGESDPEIKALDAKIADEQAREQDAIDQMHPRIRERVTKQTPTPKAKSAPAPSQYKVGDKVTLKNNQQVTITKINPNGTFEYR